METLDRTALALVIIGALNWLLVGIAGFDIVASIFGSSTMLISKIIYTVIGIAGIWSLRLFTKPQIEAKS